MRDVSLVVVLCWLSSIAFWYVFWTGFFNYVCVSGLFLSEFCWCSGDGTMVYFLFFVLLIVCLCHSLIGWFQGFGCFLGGRRSMGLCNGHTLDK